MELTPALWDSDFRDDLLPKLHSVTEKIKKRKKLRSKLIRPILRNRTGVIQDTVKHVLLVAGKPVKVKEIHQRCEEILGKPVKYKTVVDCLREKRRVAPLFDRIGRGVYQIHI